MATKSIYKDVRIKDRNSARRLVNALKKAETVSAQSTPWSQKVRTIREPDDIRNILGNN